MLSLDTMSSEPAKRETSDPDWSKAYRETKDVPWYLDSIDNKVTPEVSRRCMARHRAACTVLISKVLTLDGADSVIAGKL